MYIDSTDIISLSAQIKQMKIIMHEIWIKACRWHAQIKVWHAYSRTIQIILLRPQLYNMGVIS